MAVSYDRRAAQLFAYCILDEPPTDLSISFFADKPTALTITSSGMTQVADATALGNVGAQQSWAKIEDAQGSLRQRIMQTSQENKDRLVAMNEKLDERPCRVPNGAELVVRETYKLRDDGWGMKARNGFTWQITTNLLHRRWRWRWNTITHTAFVVFAFAQLFLINYWPYLFHGDRRLFTWFGWLDVAVVIAFALAPIWHCARIYTWFCPRVATKFEQREKSIKTSTAATMWLVYAVVFCVKIFTVYYVISPSLSEDELNYERGLVTTIAVTFLLLVLSENFDDVDSLREREVASLLKEVPVDLLDTVQLMDLLYVKLDPPNQLPQWLTIAIIVVCCINFILPAYAIRNLKYVDEEAAEEQTLCNVCCDNSGRYLWIDTLTTNLPACILRVLVIRQEGVSWDNETSIFLMKNIVSFIDSFRAILERLPCQRR